MKLSRTAKEQVLVVQLIVGVALVATIATGAAGARSGSSAGLSLRHAAPVPIPRETPLIIEPLYDDPEVVSDEELASVLVKVQPRFPRERLKPNYVEHALRTWSLKARFADPDTMSGEALKEFLTDYSQHLASWGVDIPPLLIDDPSGVAIRWGKEDGASVHHDHWLASLTEAGVSLHEPVFTPSRSRQIADVLQQALLDFRLDETEVEWSAMAFGLWIAPQKTWTTRDGRTLSFDLLADRLMRGHKRFGVCSGTHRLYSLVVLLRLDDDFDILSDATRARIMDHMRSVRDLIAVCQFEDGHWASNWAEGRESLLKPIEDELYKKVIATGHHLEWMAIAPAELHVPREQILKAADWVILTTQDLSDSDIVARYTFFSHVGNALALWRKTHPAEFWAEWQAAHPDYETAPADALQPVRR